MRGIVDSLMRTTRSLNWSPAGTEWADYYSSTQNYEDQALQSKKALVEAILDEIRPVDVWDLGANTGIFSQMATKREIPTISFDIDPGAVEINYLQCKQTGDKWRLPLLLDLTNPTPAIGWKNNERESLLNRGPTELVLALALIHHLAISNNVPIAELAKFFSDLGKFVLIEFVPKTDPQVQRLLAFREDIFNDYNQHTFEEQFSKYFSLLRKEPIEESKRVVYLFRNKVNLDQ
jgi:ribosomal protein L11 methylase PrmA